MRTETLSCGTLRSFFHTGFPITTKSRWQHVIHLNGIESSGISSTTHSVASFKGRKLYLRNCLKQSTTNTEDLVHWDAKAGQLLIRRPRLWHSDLACFTDSKVSPLTSSSYIQTIDSESLTVFLEILVMLKVKSSTCFKIHMVRNSRLIHLWIRSTDWSVILTTLSCLSHGWLNYIIWSCI